MRGACSSLLRSSPRPVFAKASSRPQWNACLEQWMRHSHERHDSAPTLTTFRYRRLFQIPCNLNCCRLSRCPPALRRQHLAADPLRTPGVDVHERDRRRLFPRLETKAGDGAGDGLYGAPSPARRFRGHKRTRGINPVARSSPRDFPTARSARARRRSTRTGRPTQCDRRRTGRRRCAGSPE